VRLILNVIWLVFSGFWMFLGWTFVGALWCITIIGIPFGLASFRWLILDQKELTECLVRRSSRSAWVLRTVRS
jgi:uncharacterized membrane protein YccF (DUF307 family)